MDWGILFLIFYALPHRIICQSSVFRLRDVSSHRRRKNTSYRHIRPWANRCSPPTSPHPREIWRPPSPCHHIPPRKAPLVSTEKHISPHPPAEAPSDRHIPPLSLRQIIMRKDTFFPLTLHSQSSPDGIANRRPQPRHEQPLTPKVSCPPPGRWVPRPTSPPMRATGKQAGTHPGRSHCHETQPSLRP